MAGKVNVPITVGIQGLTKSVSQLNALGASLSKVGKTAGLAAIAYGTFATGIKVGDFAVQAVAGARDLERNLAGLETVFGNVTPRMEAFSKSASSMGLSMAEASKSATFIGSVMKQSGFDINQTADLTERLVGLATDLSITYGYDVQEALLGMTALFRGEYDPIEKFGVAMKQSEINAELAARGQDNLTGAARRFAEQQIRVELLFQRSQDAQGAYMRQSGTLAVEQQRLAAAFANVKDTVATSLLPVIADLMVQLQGVMDSVGPEIKKVFDDLAPVLEDAGNVLIPAMVDGFMLFLETLGEIVDLLGQAFNPLTDLGESFAALGIQVESVFKTITGSQLSVEAVFDGITWVINLVVDALHDLLYIIDNTVIGFQVMGEMVTALFTGDWNKLVNTDWSGQIKYQINLKDAVNAHKLEWQKLNAEIDNQASILAKANTAWANSWIARGEWAKSHGLVPEIDPGAGGGGSSVSNSTTKTITDYVKNFTDKMQEEVQKQTARAKMRAMGASEGLIDTILSSEGWMKIWLQIKQQTLSLAELQQQYYKTAAGAKELKDAAEAAADAIQEYKDKVLAIVDALKQTIADLRKQAEETKNAFAELLFGFRILPTVTRQLGQFEQQIADFAETVHTALKDALANEDITSASYRMLSVYADTELKQLRMIAQQRDDLATRHDLASALIGQYRAVFAQAMSLTSAIDSAAQKTREISVTEVKKGVVKLKGDLREFQVTVTKTYNETIDETSNKTEELVTNFRTMADKAKSFARNLVELRQMGLDPELFQQLVDAGVVAGGETAQALVDGGADTITEINNLYQEIDALGADLGEQVASTLYGTGIDMADGLLAGIASRQAALEAQAIAMADAFNNAFQSRITVAVDTKTTQKVQEATQQAIDEIKDIPVPPGAEEWAQEIIDGLVETLPEVIPPEVITPEVTAPVIDTKALAQLDSLIEGANRYVTNITDPLKKIGGSTKLGIYQTLYDAVASGAQIDTSGIVSGLSSSELAARATTAVAGTNITINVTADTRTGGAKAGEAIVQSINNFQNANGSFISYLK